ncbi:MAG: sigW 5 [Phycisphaerales bacterium]|nr:sigW 5 [Phycisphaerales bacterium]
MVRIFYLAEHVKLRGVTVDPPNDPRSDQDLVAAANGGDPSAFDALYHRHKAWVLSLATRFTGDADQALDVLQETFIYLLSKFPGFKLTSRLSTFLYPAVKNISIAVRRKSAKFGGGQQPFDTLPAPVAARQNELVAIVSGLPETHREVVLMRFVDGLSLEEIGVALGIPLGTVKSRLHNALATLREDPRVQRFFEP